MPATCRQMANRRKAHGITRKALLSRLGCGESWCRWLEMGVYNGPCVSEWRDKYETALNELIEEKRAKKR